jgi:hypothetical protein
MAVFKFLPKEKCYYVPGVTFSLNPMAQHSVWEWLFFKISFSQWCRKLMVYPVCKPPALFNGTDLAMEFWIENHPVSMQFNKLLELKLLRYKSSWLDRIQWQQQFVWQGAHVQFCWIWQTQSTLLDNCVYDFTATFKTCGISATWPTQHVVSNIGTALLISQ